MSSDFNLFSEQVGLERIHQPHREGLYLTLSFSFVEIYSSDDIVERSTQLLSSFDYVNVNLRRD